MINCAEYWPNPGSYDTITNTYTDGIVNIYSYATDTPGHAGPGVRMRQNVNGVWSFDWFYRFDPARGVLEYEDDYPKPWWLLWGNVKAQPMISGREIVWGGNQNLGDIVQHGCAWSFLGTTTWGWQRVQIVQIIPTYTDAGGKTHTNVLQIEYWQEWGSGATAGAVMYLAKNIGQVYTAWTSGGSPTGYSMSLISHVPALIS